MKNKRVDVHQQCKPKRVFTLDTIRGYVLFFMAFANLYYAISFRQIWVFSHDNQTMAPADLIAIFFFIMIGFNLALIQKYKQITGIQLLRYAWKRAFMIIGIGVLLVSYSIAIFGSDYSVFFRSVLVILGLSLLLTSTLVYLFANQIKYWPYLFLILSILYGVLNQNPTGNYRFLSVAFLLTSVLGYIAGVYYTLNYPKFFKFMQLIAGISFLLAALHYLSFKTVPTRLTINAPYIYLCWGFWFLLLGALLHFYRNKDTSKTNSPLKSIQKYLNLSGAYPLSFWILHSFVVALFVMGTTFYKYWKDNMLNYYLQMPAMTRNMENEIVAIFLALAGAILCTSLHLVFIRFYRKRTG